MGFLSGALGQIGEQVRQKNLLDYAVEHEANQQMAKQFYSMAENAEPELAPDFLKAGYAYATAKQGDAKKLNKQFNVQDLLLKHSQAKYAPQNLEQPPQEPPQVGHTPPVQLHPDMPEAGTVDEAMLNAHSAATQQIQQQIKQANDALAQQQVQAQAPPPVSGLPSPGFSSVMPAPPGSGIPFPTLPGQPGGTSGFAGPVMQGIPELGGRQKQILGGGRYSAFQTGAEKAAAASQAETMKRQAEVDFAHSIGLTSPHDIANFINKHPAEKGAGAQLMHLNPDDIVWDPVSQKPLYIAPSKVGSAAKRDAKDVGGVLFEPPPEGSPPGTPWLKVSPDKAAASDRNVPVDQQAFKGYLDKAGGDPVKAYQLMEADKERVKPASENVGTWSLVEGTDGKPVLFNSKTAQTKPVTGIQKPGTKDKRDAALEKEVGPARDAVTYAENYLNRGTFTGSGDEALLEKFFDLAKPTTGFRMSKQQIELLQNSRSWMESLSGKARHVATGTWFSDKQRKEIVQTMKDLGNAKASLVKANAGTLVAPGMPPPPGGGRKPLEDIFR